MPLLRLISVLIVPIILCIPSLALATPYAAVNQQLIAPSTANGGDLGWIVNHPATIRYSLDLKDVQQHLLHITVDFPAVGGENSGSWPG